MSWLVFRYRALNWIVDGPGWIVSRFVSVDFHEGDGAFGLFLAVLLTWACVALVIFAVARYILKKAVEVVLGIETDG